MDFWLQMANGPMQSHVKSHTKIHYFSALFYDSAHGRGKQHPVGGRGRGRGENRPGRHQRQLLAGQYVPNYVWTDTAVDGNYRPRDIPFTGV